MTGGRFRECLGGCAACGLLRKIFPQSFDRSRTLDASVGLSKGRSGLSPVVALMPLRISADLFFTACSRMCGVVDTGEMLKIEVSVNLGGCNIGVSEQFLHGAQIRAGFEQVGGEGMTQHMR